MWDGDSLFLLGTAQLSLQQCLRQGRDSVYVEDHVLDVRQSTANASAAAGANAQRLNPLVDQLLDEHQRGKASNDWVESGRYECLCARVHRRSSR